MQIQPNERDKIALWFNRGVKIREISRRLNRHPSVISRELKRNGSGTVYVAISAQNKRNKRNHQARYRHRHPLKDKTTYAYVLDKLKMVGVRNRSVAVLSKSKVVRLSIMKLFINLSITPKTKTKDFGSTYPENKRKDVKNQAERSLVVTSLFAFPSILGQKRLILKQLLVIGKETVSRARRKTRPVSIPKSKDYLV